MKKFSIILTILLAFSVLTFVGCQSEKNEDEKTTTAATFKEPTVTVSESVSFSFRESTTPSKKSKKSSSKKKPTTAPTTVYTEPQTEYVEPETEYIEPETEYVEPDTEYVEPEQTGYIDYESASSRNFTESDVQGVSADTVQSVINDIYAHHGYIFKTPEIREYYESQSWYEGTVESESEAEKNFNSYETYNKNFLSHYR